MPLKRGQFLRTFVVTEDAQDVVHTAIALVRNFESAAVHVTRERAELSMALPHMPSAEMWHDTADAIECLRSKP